MIKNYVVLIELWLCSFDIVMIKNYVEASVQSFRTINPSTV